MLVFYFRAFNITSGMDPANVFVSLLPGMEMKGIIP